MHLSNRPFPIALFRNHHAPLCSPAPLPFCTTGLHKQRHVLPRPQPPVRPVHQVLPVAHPRPGPLWPGRHPGSEPRCLFSNLVRVGLQTSHNNPNPNPDRTRMPAGGGARASRSRPRATAWCRWSSPSTPRWSTRRPKKKKKKKRHSLPPPKTQRPEPLPTALASSPPAPPPVAPAFVSACPCPCVSVCVCVCVFPRVVQGEAYSRPYIKTPFWRSS